MNQKEQQSAFHPDQFRSFVGMVVFICRALAVSVEVFLHNAGSFGERYLGLQVGAALLIMFVYPLFWEGHDPTPLFIFMGFFLFACLCIRVRTAQRVRRGGPQEHTMYTGTPTLMRRFGRMGEAKVKSIVEPMFVFITGVFTMSLSEPLGGYLMVASVGLLASTHLTIGYERRRAMDMNDAYIDQQNAVDRFRRMRGE
ncbi:MAG: hypothetical protein HRU75_09260 [Planctomycetia bacterium]|nr:MAG: hypothetical protein HRU75_09260 [Planctomycetia bacterium]